MLMHDGLRWKSGQLGSMNLVAPPSLELMFSFPCIFFFLFREQHNITLKQTKTTKEGGADPNKHFKSIISV